MFEFFKIVFYVLLGVLMEKLLRAKDVFYCSRIIVAIRVTVFDFLYKMVG